MPSSLEEFSLDLQKASKRADRDCKKVVKRGATNIKKDWKRLYKSSERFKMAPAYPRSISYDELGGGGYHRAEIGPDKGRTQGPLGNLIEFGSIHNAPQNEGGRSLRIEEPKFIEAMSDLGDI